MAFVKKKPDEVRRSFGYNNSGIRNTGPQKDRKKSSVRQNLRTSWPNKQLDYEFLEKCKEVICRIPHPNITQRHKGVEFRVSIMQWSRGAYVDIRQYSTKGPTNRGILLHQDILAQMLPELIGALREMETRDTREKEDIQIPEVIRA